MSDAAIQQYFIQRQGEGVCGHFKAAQLQRVRITLPGYVLQRKLRGWQKFLVMLLLCFGSNFMGIDVLWGGNGNALYAQTVAKSKGVAKAKKNKKRKRELQSHVSIAINRKIRPDGEIYMAGYIVTKPEPTAIMPEWGWHQQAVADSADRLNLTDKNTDKKSPPPITPSQRSEYLLPLVWRRRKKQRMV